MTEPEISAATGAVEHEFQVWCETVELLHSYGVECVYRSEEDELGWLPEADEHLTGPRHDMIVVGRDEVYSSEDAIRELDVEWSRP